MTNAADNAALVRRIFEELWNRQTFDHLEGRTATTIPFHYNGVSMEVARGFARGPRRVMRQAFPDLLMEVRLLVANEGIVAVAVVMRATHGGEQWGHRPTGRPLEAEETTSFPIRRRPPRRDVRGVRRARPQAANLSRRGRGHTNKVMRPDLRRGR